MERETKTITLPKSGKTIVLNAYFTGRELTAVQNVYLREAGDLSQDEIRESGVRGSISLRATKLGLKYLVVSIDGKKDGDLVEEVYNLPADDFRVVKAALDGETIGEKKTTS